MHGGIVKMEDFYPITSDDLGKIHEQLLRREHFNNCRIRYDRENEISFLLPLAIDLLSNADKIRELKDKFQEDYDSSQLNKIPSQLNDELKVSDGLRDIFEAWLEENKGTGNLLKLIEVLDLNEHLDFADSLEELLLEYSLPSSGDIQNRHVYSSSREFLQEDNQDTSGRNSAALQNSVVLTELFKILGDKDQKTFRLVCPTWTRETLGVWRKLAKLRIHVSEEKKKGISMASYLNLLELERKRINQEAGGSSEKNYNYKLTEHPFRTYRISYESSGPDGHEGTPFYCGEVEDKFWELCGPHMEDLQIDDAFIDYEEEDQSVHKICERLLLNACLNLKKLKISNLCTTEYESTEEGASPGNPDTSLWREMKRKKGPVKKNEFVKKKEFATGLHTLAVEIDVGAESLQSILFICPNLKTLVLELEDDLTALLHPTANGELLKLQRLTLHCSYYVSDNFQSLRDYTELLTKNEFNSLQHFHLDGISLQEARKPPFNLYAALAHCSNSLKSIELEITAGHDDEDRKWFTDLAPFSFPNLTSFKLSINAMECDLNRMPSLPQNKMKFDFGTLKGMANLELLEIRLKNTEDKEIRRPGAQDWVFEGDRNTYLPSGLIPEIYSEDDQILCSKLKEFTFQGMTLNREDIKLISAWFPNLTQLETKINHGDLPLLLENWNQLEKVDIQTKRLIPLSQLRPLKEKRIHLRIFQTLIGDRMALSVELKQHKETLYFAFAKPETKQKNGEEDDVDTSFIDFLQDMQNLRSKYSIFY